MVVDASIIVRLLANRPADEDLRGRFAVLHTVHAPHLIDSEVASATRGLLLGGRITLPRAVEMLADFAGLRIKRYPMHTHLSRVIELRNNLTAYDAAYVALAEMLRMPLLTQDPKLGRTSGRDAEVQLYRAR
ncbi:MAG: type II toxin-antitoxin system VapC family toxin [Pseudonocardiaceae bacterium]